MRVLVTGGRGFVGTHLVSALEKSGNQVLGVDLPDWNLLDSKQVKKTLSDQPWDVVVHLAGMSHAQECEQRPADAYQVNVVGTLLLMEAVESLAQKPRIVFPSTAHIYETDGTKKPIDETGSVWPKNVYGRTKHYCELVLKEFAEKESANVTILRLFNHVHKSQGSKFFLPSLYQSLLKVKSGEQKEVPVGNLDLWRDFGSVADLVKALVAVVEKKDLRGYELFNICNGQTRNLRELAECMSQAVGISSPFVVDQARLRPGEPQFICGSHQKITQKVGWAPTQYSDQALVESFLSDQIN